MTSTDFKILVKEFPHVVKRDYGDNLADAFIVYPRSDRLRFTIELPLFEILDELGFVNYVQDWDNDIFTELTSKSYLFGRDSSVKIYKLWFHDIETAMMFKMKV